MTVAMMMMMMMMMMTMILMMMMMMMPIMERNNASVGVRREAKNRRSWMEFRRKESKRMQMEKERSDATLR